jgi:hypothetical protein
MRKVVLSAISLVALAIPGVALAGPSLYSGNYCPQETGAYAEEATYGYGSSPRYHGGYYKPRHYGYGYHKPRHYGYGGYRGYGGYGRY